jgi:hypothetical protein
MLNKRAVCALALIFGADVANLIVDYEDETMTAVDALKIAIGLEIRLFVFNVRTELRNRPMRDALIALDDELRLLKMRDEYEVWLAGCASAISKMTGRPLFIGASRRSRAAMAVRYASDLVNYECLCGTICGSAAYLMGPRHTRMKYHQELLQSIHSRLDDTANELFGKDV